ncbi:MAG: hypothetical protein MUE44_21790 [Oscillatoriaceae cyanobacterium Prado104]|jgi:hypothetical protein|nr:hypothetical protein [Oscillatoriaceae cyanobacterium Prado104]
MAYSDFKLKELVKQFDLTLNENQDLFGGTPEVEPSETLKFWLIENSALATDINTEKARSELIIAPILLEVRRQLNYQIGLFSGSEFNVAPEKGLNGTCDFLLTGGKKERVKFTFRYILLFICAFLPYRIKSC